MSKAHKRLDAASDEAEVPGRDARSHDVSPEAEKWRSENAEAAKAWAEWVDKNGVPLEDYRMF